MRDIIQNKKLREVIQWYKNLLTAQPLQVIMPTPIINNNNNNTNIQTNPNPNIQTMHNPPKMLFSNMLNTINHHNFANSSNLSNMSTMQNMSSYQQQFNPMIYPGMQNFQMQNMLNNLKKVDTLDNVVDNNEGDMTTEEKMQLYNKINEADVTRKQSEDKVFDDYKSSSENGIENKSIKDNKEQSIDKQILIQPTINQSHPIHHLPYLPAMNPLMNPLLNPMMNPLLAANSGIKNDPSMIPFRGYDPRMMHHMNMMQQAYGYAPGMSGMPSMPGMAGMQGIPGMGIIPPVGTALTKEKKKSKSKSESSSSEDSKVSAKESKHKNRKRSRTRSRDKEKERDRERERDKDRKTHKSKRDKRDKDRSDKEKDTDKNDRDRNRYRDKEKDKSRGERDKDKSYKSKKK